MVASRSSEKISAQMTATKSTSGNTAPSAAAKVATFPSRSEKNPLPISVPAIPCVMGSMRYRICSLNVLSFSVIANEVRDPHFLHLRIHLHNFNQRRPLRNDATNHRAAHSMAPQTLHGRIHILLLHSNQQSPGSLRIKKQIPIILADASAKSARTPPKTPDYSAIPQTKIPPEPHQSPPANIPRPMLQPQRNPAAHRHLPRMSQQSKSRHISHRMHRRASTPAAAINSCKASAAARFNRVIDSVAARTGSSPIFPCFNPVAITPVPNRLRKNQSIARPRPHILPNFPRIDQPRHRVPKFQFVIANRMPAQHAAPASVIFSIRRA